MKNNIIILIMLAAMATGCGTFKKAATVPDTTTTTTTTPNAIADPVDAVIASLGQWHTMQTSGNIKLSAGSSFSSSIQVRMVRDEAIFISLRPMLGIEVGRLLITADSLYAVDKLHKRYIAEKVSILTSGIPVTVSDMQDIFLGRPFVIGKGTLDESLKNLVTAIDSGKDIYVKANEAFKGYGYAFAFNKSRHINLLSISPEGSLAAPDYVVNYSDVRSTQAGNIAHGLNAVATIENKKVSLSLTYKNIDWNGNVKIDRSLPNGYSRMSARDLFSLFSN